jgi:hypothetical protein
MKVHKNRMTIANSGTVGSVFFHEYAFVASDHCHVLSLKDDTVDLDEDLFIYLRPILESIRQHYNFGREINDRRLRREVVEIPVQIDGTPDWEGMRELSRELRSGVQFNALASDLERGEPTVLSVETWKRFRVRDVFERIIGGYSSSAGELLDGSDLYYVGATHRDNGVMRLVQRPEVDRAVLKGPCLAFITNGQGSVGYSTFVPLVEFVGTADNKYGYHRELDSWTAAFLIAVLDLNRPRFSFGRKWGSRLADTEIDLPSTVDGTPDWIYMRTYMQQLQYGDQLKA